MNVIRELRNARALSQAEFAALTGTSQSTVAGYEAGSKSPSLKTLARIGNCLHQQLVLQWSEKLTREDARSLAIHRAIGQRLMQEPEPILTRARNNLDTWERQRPAAAKLFRRWQQWLQLPLDDLILLMLSPSLAARDMRQVSPFAGVLSAPERAKVIAQFQREYTA